MIEPKEKKWPPTDVGGHFIISKSLAEFAAKAANKIKIIFRRGVYLAENTSQAASVEFVCRRQANYARSRLRKTGGKGRRPFSTSLNAPDGCRGSFHVLGSAAAWDTGSGSGNKKGAGKIRPNTVIIPHSFFQVNGEMASRRQNLCPAQKQTSSFGEHSVLKSSKIHDIL